MPMLPNYTQFDGRYWDTGVIRNALDYQMKYETFSEHGSEATARIFELEAQLSALKTVAESDFPVTELEVADLRAEIRWHVLHVLEAEQEAVTPLRAAMIGI